MNHLVRSCIAFGTIVTWAKKRTSLLFLWKKKLYQIIFEVLFKLGIHTKKIVNDLLPDKNFACPFWFFRETNFTKFFVKLISRKKALFFHIRQNPLWWGLLLDIGAACFMGWTLQIDRGPWAFVRFPKTGGFSK